MKKRLLSASLYSLTSIFLLLGSRHYGMAQSPNTANLVTATIGNQCPDFFLTDVYYYAKKTVSSKELKGQPVILDFFGSHCAVCFQGFPEMNRIHNKYSGKLQVLLIGDLDSTIKRVYEKFNKRYNLTLPVAFDSILFKKWQIVMMPYEVWVDAQGIVQAITGPSSLTESNIERFIDHGTLDLPLSKNKQQFQEDIKSFNYRKPLLVNGNAGNDSAFLYRSLLATWKREQGYSYARNLMHEFGNTFQGVAIPLGELYELAYGDTVNFSMPPMDGDDNEPNNYGKIQLKPILRVRDPSLFVPDFIKCKNLYDYSLILPVKAASAYYLQAAMRRDLKNYFGYEVRVVRRKAYYWKLETTRKWKKTLITKGGAASEGFTYAGFALQNMPIKKVISIAYSVKEWELFIDKTGIQGNIDLHIDTIMTEFEDFRKALAAKGLFLVKAQKKIKTIMIYDPKEKFQ